jgi:hypothetical protein
LFLNIFCILILKSVLEYYLFLHSDHFLCILRSLSFLSFLYFHDE